MCPTFTDLQKIIIINISILHKCKKSRNANRLLKVESTQLEFDKENIEEKSTMNPFYEDDIEI